MAKDDITPDNSRITLVTQDGYEKLVQELANLKNVKRKEIAEKLKEAISYGDLSENSEYEEAKNEQAFVEGRILDLEDKVKNAKIIADDKKKGKASTTVQFGSTVTVQNITDKSAKPEVYTVVGSTEANPFESKISKESPLGMAILEKAAGDEVEVVAPRGKIAYKIVKIA